MRKLTRTGGCGGSSWTGGLSTPGWRDSISNGENSQGRVYFVKLLPVHLWAGILGLGLPWSRSLINTEINGRSLKVLPVIPMLLHVMHLFGFYLNEFSPRYKIIESKSWEHPGFYHFFNLCNCLLNRNILSPQIPKMSSPPHPNPALPP